MSMLLCNCYFLQYNFLLLVIINCYNFVKFKISLNYPNKTIVNLFLNYCNKLCAKLISWIVLFNNNVKKDSCLTRYAPRLSPVTDIEHAY